LGERARTALIVGVRPEQGEQFLSGDPTLPGSSEQREDRHTSGLRRGSGDRLAVAVADGQTTERTNANHVRSTRLE